MSYAADLIRCSIAALLLGAAAQVRAQIPIAIESPPKPDAAMKLVYGGNTWRDARVAAFFGGRSPALRADIRMGVCSAVMLKQIRPGRVQSR